MPFSIDFSKDKPVLDKSEQDLGFCPRCKDPIQPEHIEGYASRSVDGVLFCTLCAWHLEADPAEREKWAKLAKTEASV